MTSLFSTRRRAEEFAAAVDGRARNVPEDLQALVGVATALRSYPEIEHDAVPRAEFAADLRARLMAEADEVLAPGAGLVLPTRRRGPRERRLVAAASVAVILGGTASMAAAAQSALPGEALYPIKRGIENAEAGLSVSPAGKGRDLLTQASDRLDEVQGLLADDGLTAAPQVPGTLEDFAQQAREGSDLLMAAFQETRDPSTIEAVREFTAEGIVVLQGLARTAPASAQPELADAALTLKEIDEQAAALCSSCASDLPALEVPGIFLAAAEVDRALEFISPGMLDNSHPVVVDRATVEEGLEALTGAAAPKEDDGSDAPQAPSTSTTPESSPESGLGIDLPDGGDITQNNKNVKDVEKSVEGTVGDLTDGLSGLVETLLPEPDLG